MNKYIQRPDFVFIYNLPRMSSQEDISLSEINSDISDVSIPYDDSDSQVSHQVKYAEEEDPKPKLDHDANKKAEVQLSDDEVEPKLFIKDPIVKRQMNQEEEDDELFDMFLNDLNAQDKEIMHPQFGDMRQVIPDIGINVLCQTMQKKGRPTELKGQDRRSMNVLSRFEYAKLIGLRARQISQGSAIYTRLNPGEKGWLTSIEIAEREFREGKMPFRVKRSHDDNTYEFWQLNELFFDFAHTARQLQHIADPYEHKFGY